MPQTVITTTAVSAASLDLIEVADFKQELKISGSADDGWIGKVITRASKAIAKHCNRIFQVQTYQERFWAARDSFPWQLPTGVHPLQLACWPLASAPSPAGCAPPQAPVLSAAAGGSLPAQTYYVKISYVTPAGETAGSVEASLAVAANALVVVAAPGPDPKAIATGWNVYIGTKSFGETLQNAAPLALDASFTLPTTGLLATTAALPAAILVVIDDPNAPRPLAEGVDFLSDYDGGPQPSSVGQLTRLSHIANGPRMWSELPILVQYQAGYPAIPDDVQDACIRLVKTAWFARTRDPRLRQENVEGVYSATWWFANGPGGGALPPDVEALIDAYRVPVIA